MQDSRYPGATRGDPDEYASSANSLRVDLPDSDASVALGKVMGANFRSGIGYICGDLGAGKTTLVRGLLRARGVEGPVRSPTYSLIESYATAAGFVYHLDLYRLADPQELYFIGIDEIDVPGALALIEWPERGGDLLPAADFLIRLSYPAATGKVPGGERGTADGDDGRDALIEARSLIAAKILQRIAKCLSGQGFNWGTSGGVENISRSF